jgi:hypothetical protein
MSFKQCLVSARLREFNQVNSNARYWPMSLKKARIILNVAKNFVEC